MHAEDQMKKYMRYLGPVLIFAIFCLAVFLLYDKVKQYSLEQIQDAMQQVSLWRIVVCFVATAVSYCILVGYDWLAIHAIGKKLAFPRVCLVSFIGQTVSYNFGALLGGTTVRYRFYSAWDFSLSDIVRLVLMLAVTFWIGVLGLCGIFFVVAPPHMPDELVKHMPFVNLQVLGAILFLVALLYMVLCFTVRKPIKIFEKEFVFPTPKIAVAQLIVAGVDILAAAFCMYILLPGSLGISFWEFVPGYLLAQVAVVLTHIPGGVGIFELVIIHLTHTDQTQVVFAAVLLFRLFYYIIPLLLAALLFGGYEVSIRKNFLAVMRRRLRVIAHTVVASCVYVCGILCLLSSFFGTSSPLFRSALGQYGLAACGVLLLFVAYGLNKRRACAKKTALFTLSCACLFAVLQDFSFVVFAACCACLLLLGITRHRFYRKTTCRAMGIQTSWFCAALGTAFLILCAGLYWHWGELSWASFCGRNDAVSACRVLRSALAFCLFAVVAIRWQRRKQFATCFTGLGSKA